MAGIIIQFTVPLPIFFGPWFSFARGDPYGRRPKRAETGVCPYQDAWLDSN